MQRASTEEGNRENLQLHIQNTFFHVKDANAEAFKAHFLWRSRSDSSFGSKKSSLSSSSLRSQQESRQPHHDLSRSSRAQEHAEHMVWSTPDSSYSDDSASAKALTSGAKKKGSSSSAVEHSSQNHLLPTSVQTSSAGKSNAFKDVPKASHADGTCTPCVLWPQNRCSNSDACPFCHLCTLGERPKTKKNRPSRTARESKARYLAEHAWKLGAPEGAEVNQNPLSPDPMIIEL